MKGVHGSEAYVDRLIADFEKRGAIILKGNGGWMKIDIIRNHDLVKIGEVEIVQEDMSDEEIEGHLFDFFSNKYREAKFLVQEITNDKI